MVKKYKHFYLHFSLIHTHKEIWIQHKHQRLGGVRVCGKDAKLDLERMLSV